MDRGAGRDRLGGGVKAGQAWLRCFLNSPDCTTRLDPDSPWWAPRFEDNPNFRAVAAILAMDLLPPIDFGDNIQTLIYDPQARKAARDRYIDEAASRWGAEEAMAIARLSTLPVDSDSYAEARDSVCEYRGRIIMTREKAGAYWDEVFDDAVCALEVACSNAASVIARKKGRHGRLFRAVCNMLRRKGTKTMVDTSN